jgi:hypothetical protein
MFVRRHALWRIPSLLLFAATVVTAVRADNESVASYQCDQHWSGPAIVLPAGLLPLPHGYALTDRTSHPHAFGNFAAAILKGEELGTILVGFTPNQEEWFANESEFRVRQFTWNGVLREHLRHLSTGREMEVFSFADGVMMQFSGAALPFAEVVASCYLELASANVDAKRSNSKT